MQESQQRRAQPTAQFPLSSSVCGRGIRVLPYIPCTIIVNGDRGGPGLISIMVREGIDFIPMRRCACVGVCVFDCDRTSVRHLLARGRADFVNDRLVMFLPPVATPAGKWQAGCFKLFQQAFQAPFHTRHTQWDARCV